MWQVCFYSRSSCHFLSFYFRHYNWWRNKRKITMQKDKLGAIALSAPCWAEIPQWTVLRHIRYLHAPGVSFILYFFMWIDAVIWFVSSMVLVFRADCRVNSVMFTNTISRQKYSGATSSAKIPIFYEMGTGKASPLWQCVGQGQFCCRKDPSWGYLY